MHQIPSVVADGIRKFLRLQQLPLQEHQLRQNADVFDLMDGFDLVVRSFQGTSRVVDQQLHQTSKYSHSEDVKRELEENLLVGKTDRETAHLRKKHLTMYRLVLEPLVDELSSMGHTAAIITAHDLLPILNQMVTEFDQYGTEDDALVAKHLIGSIVKQREEKHRLQKELAKKTARKRKNEDNVISTFDDDVEL